MTSNCGNENINAFINSFESDGSKKIIARSEKDKLEVPIYEEGIYLFLSYDICNSTELKSKCSYWQEIVEAFYSNAVDGAFTKWKYIGDEVVFYCKYKDIKSLVDVIKKAYSWLDNVKIAFSGVVSKHNGQNDSDEEIDIDIKASLWCAKVSDGEIIKNNGEYKPAIRLNSIDEFIGTEIDEGFRMSLHSSNHKLLIDPKLILLLLSVFCFLIKYENISQKELKGTTVDFDEAFISKFILSTRVIEQYLTKNEANDNVKNAFLKVEQNVHSLIEHIYSILKSVYFVDFVVLKGIWKGNPYPIFWYVPVEEDNNYYEYVRRLKDDLMLKSEQPIYMSTDLYTVFEKVKQTEQINEIINYVFRLAEPEKVSYVSDGISSLYYTVACVLNSSKKVLVAKRKSQRVHLGNVWEFCVCKHNNSDMNTSIIKKIREELGISVKLCCDDTDEKNIIPLHFCTVYRNQKKHNSILCCAEIDIDNEETDEAQLIEKIDNYLKDHPESTYSKVDFVGIDDIDNSNCFLPLNSKDIEDNSYNSKSFVFKPEDNYASMYFYESIECVLHFFDRYKKVMKPGENRKKPLWGKLFC